MLDVAIAVARIGAKSVTYEFRFTHEGRDVADGQHDERVLPDRAGRAARVAADSRRDGREAADVRGVNGPAGVISLTPGHV